ncbi:MAG: gephyrin-like molybdotransferase Glp [Tepidisphaeraceae bacterium]
MSELDVSKLMTIESAMSIIDAVTVAPRTSTLELSQTLGLHLASDLRNDRDSPPFDKSLMDGYALRSADATNTPCEVTVTGTIAAGGSPAESLRPGQAVAIMTGAPLPTGADAVIPIESTRAGDGSNRIQILEPAVPGKFIARQGSDARAGVIVLRAGDPLGPAQIAVAASIGATLLPVFDPPTVAILGTGDELVPPDQTPTGSQIRSSNNAMLVALLSRYPCKVADLGLVPDVPAAIERKLADALNHDIAIITGGMSMGAHDYVPEILHRLGGDLKVTKLRVKPGKPFVFAEMPGGKFAFGLPGNPVSAFVCTISLVSRLLRRMAGGPPAPPANHAPLAQSLEPNGPRTFYLPAIYDGQSLTPLHWKGSADIFTLARANALIIRPENQPAQSAGAQIAFIPI